MMPRSNKGQWQNQSLKNPTEDQSFKAGEEHKMKCVWCTQTYTVGWRKTAATLWWGVCLQISEQNPQTLSLPSLSAIQFFFGGGEEGGGRWGGGMVLVVVEGFYSWGNVKIFVLTIRLIAFCSHCHLTVLYYVLKLYFQDPLPAVF